MEYVPSSSLFSALLVNKAWLGQAIKVLWREPPVEALASIRHTRRQSYANLVEKLFIRGRREAARNAKFRKLEFPRLWYANIVTGYYHPLMGRTMCVGQYIQPSLKMIRFEGAEPAEDVLRLLEKRCPQLELVDIDHNFRGLSSERLVKFLHRCKCMKQIYFGYTMEHSVDAKVLECLVNYKNLEVCVLVMYENCFSYRTLEKVFGVAKQPFRDLETLQIGIEPEAIPLLVKYIKSVTTLHLHVKEGQFGLVREVGSLINLKVLSVCDTFESGEKRGEWTGNDFMGLKELTNLEQLTIGLDCPSLTNKKFISVLENKIELAWLELDGETSITTKAFTWLGEHFPNLMYCRLNLICDVRSWRNNSHPLFPELRFLKLRAVIYGKRAPR